MRELIRLPRLEEKGNTGVLDLSGDMLINIDAVDVFFWNEYLGYSTILLRSGVAYYSTSTEDEIIEKLKEAMRTERDNK